MTPPIVTHILTSVLVLLQSIATALATPAFEVAGPVTEVVGAVLVLANELVGGGEGKLAELVVVMENVPFGEPLIKELAPLSDVIELPDADVEPDASVDVAAGAPLSQCESKKGQNHENKGKPGKYQPDWNYGVERKTPR
ncbi:hypothetical protein SERLADRAFT_435924 [Serpula lacrymans var. lacrymans S7.9]|uniref:Uncharacterized protein n=1 Tax=Serpula lacrymans var. lacrymans (strain S7.9) TaxID=578457 RepID=F8NQE6_SERL9|nr:uncharacterized protein SERLADRAFT_435924 [Serpula lacrymans var. lacrymans S7.9]EGO26076.1 hypothetical protein SERLADRAFT_435924 [Serpula lacrymans var. lacrymans S7.9]